MDVMCKWPGQWRVVWLQAMGSPRRGNDSALQLNPSGSGPSGSLRQASVSPSVKWYQLYCCQRDTV